MVRERRDGEGVHVSPTHLATRMQAGNIGSGTLIFQRGKWDNGSFTVDATYNSQQVIIGDTSYTLNDIKDAINQGNIGVTASVIKKTATDYALALRAETGASNSFEIKLVQCSGFWY